MTLTYKPLNKYTLKEIEEIIANGDLDDVAQLPFSVGENYPDWKMAQEICIQLASHSSPRVRSNAVLGLAYIARTKGKLEKHIVKPIILKELRENDEYRWRIIDAIEDINIFLKWKLAEKAILKFKEK